MAIMDHIWINGKKYRRFPAKDFTAHIMREVDFCTNKGGTVTFEARGESLILVAGEATWTWEKNTNPGTVWRTSTAPTARGKLPICYWIGKTNFLKALEEAGVIQK